MGKGLDKSKRWAKAALVAAGVLIAGVALVGAAPGFSKGGAASGAVLAEEAPARVIVLSARNLAFSDTNPTLELRAGERVRLVIRNIDPGITHSFAIPGLRQANRKLSFGEELTVDVTADQIGEFEYTCPRHMPTMKGKIVVRP